MRVLHLLLASVVSVAVLLLLAGASLAEDPVDVTPPTGTLTVGNGTGFTNTPVVNLHVPATDDVGLVSVEVMEDSRSAGVFPYADDIQFELVPQPYDSQPDGEHQLYVMWRDAAGNIGVSDGQLISLDRVAPTFTGITFPSDAAPNDDVRPVDIHAGDANPGTMVRLSSNGTSAWSPWQSLEWMATTDWHYLDPDLGGSPLLGPRSLYVQVRDAAGNTVPVQHVETTAEPRPPLTVSPDVPVTGQKMTIAPQFPAPVTYPAGTICQWEVSWGDNQSLYYADHDDTYGFFFIRGKVSSGFCKPLSFTVPWMPYRQMMVSLEIDIPGLDGGIDASIGGSPDKEPIRPALGSTDRHITWANMPLVYVLPEDYTLTLGQSTTYRAYALAGATIGSDDQWSLDYTDDRVLKWGGTSYTFTPTRTGFVTVCWNSDTSHLPRFAACYDPPVRRRDSTPPNTTAPVARLVPGVVATTVPVSLTWTGSDVGWGISTYQLERSTDGGAYHRILSKKVTTTNQALVPGHAYRYRVRAVDRAGHVGAWDYGPTLHPQLRSDADPGVTYGAGWEVAADVTALGGSLRESSTANAWARLVFTGRDIAWLAERGPGHGRARVYVDGKLAATVDLNASADLPARILFRQHWSAIGQHSVKIVVEGTVGRPIVSVDGFAVLR